MEKHTLNYNNSEEFEKKLVCVGDGDHRSPAIRIRVANSRRRRAISLSEKTKPQPFTRLRLYGGERDL